MTRVLKRWSQKEIDTITMLAPLYQRNFEAYRSFLPGRSACQIKSYYRNNKLDSVQMSKADTQELSERDDMETKAVL